jgi:hypothetical protein
LASSACALARSDDDEKRVSGDHYFIGKTFTNGVFYSNDIPCKTGGDHDSIIVWHGRLVRACEIAISIHSVV